MEAAAAAFGTEKAPRLITSGGRTWEGFVEADAMASDLEELGVPATAIVRERCSMSTAENARYCAELLRRHRLERIVLVTCAWPLPRALRLFEREGLRCTGAAAESPDPGPLGRAYRVVRERICMRLDGVT